MPCDLAIPLLGIDPEKSIIEKAACTPVFIAALFKMARTWTQPRFYDGWMDEEDVVHIHDIYPHTQLAIKKEKNSESVELRLMNLVPVIWVKQVWKRKSNIMY